MKNILHVDLERKLPMNSWSRFLYLLIGIQFLTVNATHSQWTKQSPFPTDRSLNGVALASPTDVFIVGDDRHLLESTDGGATWSTDMGSDFSADPFYMVHFSDATHGYVTGNNNDAWRTTDGGVTWVQMTTVPAGSWYTIDFITPTEGFIGANGAVAYTSNGGSSWILKSGYPTCPVIFGMDFRDTQVGLAGGILVTTSENGIFKTTNGGVSWTKKLSSSANDIKWVSESTALAIVGTVIYRSTNAGDTWTPFSNAIFTGLLSFDLVDATTLVGVSGGGDIWRSSDGGAVWTMVLEGIGDLPTSWHVSFFDNLNGFVVGQSGIIYASHDGGLTWSMMNSGIGIQLFDLEMQSATFGLAACHNGYVLRTTNGGARWETSKVEVTGQIFGRDESLRGVSIVDEGFAVLAGPGGTVFRTFDGGLTWESIGYPNLPDPFWIDDVDFVNRSEGWLVGTDFDFGADKTVYKTTDGGTTWAVAMYQASNMYSVDFVDAQHGWIGTIGSLFFRTTDGGTTWVQGTLPGGPTSPRIRFSSLTDGWAVGWFGYVARTTNGGVSWTVQNIGSNDNLLRVDAVSATEVWIAGSTPSPSLDGVVHHTTNAGVSWSREVPTEYPYTLNVVSALPTGEAWVGGYGGNIMRNGVATGGQPPVVSDIPDQTVAVGGRFASIRADNYVADPDDPDSVITWSWTGNSSLRVLWDPVRRRIVVRPPRNWVGSETITFTASDPDGLSDSDPAIFTVSSSGSTSAIERGASSGEIPSETLLEGNYPNPFNPTTTIWYGLAARAHVSLVVYNILGQQVAVLAVGEQEEGYHEVVFDARNLPSGVYLLRLSAADYMEFKKLVLSK
jgi:photosystem II stability/assembly factor-like uncharacterized protein